MTDNEQTKNSSFEGSTREKILWMSSQYKVPDKLTKQEALDRVMERIESGEPVRKGKSVKLYQWMGAVAASLLIVFSIYIISNSYSQEKYKTLKGQQAEYVLPDGTKITLNADSKISYSPRKFKLKRHLQMSGEIFMDVEKGGEFVITTPNGKVRILGTELNIVSREDFFKVSCISGKVQVISDDSEQVITKGESAELINGQLYKNQEKNIDQIISWQVGELYFEDSSLISIFEELERQFDVSIIYREAYPASFTGSISNKNLKEALDIVCIPMNLSYEVRKTNKIIITGKSG